MKEKSGFYDQGAPIGKGRSRQAKTNEGAVSSQESKLGGHRKNTGGGKKGSMPSTESGARTPLSADNGGQKDPHASDKGD